MVLEVRYIVGYTLDIKTIYAQRAGFQSSHRLHSPTYAHILKSH